MEIAAKSDHFARLLQPRAGPSAVASDVSIPLYGFESRCYVTVMANGPWCGKWALVTGASSGIGAALAEELAAFSQHPNLRRIDLRSLAEVELLQSFDARQIRAAQPVEIGRASCRERV